MTGIDRQTNWLLAPGSARALGAIRILVGLYGVIWLAVSVGELTSLGDLDHGRFRPVGVIGVLGLRPVPTWLIGAAWLVTVVAAGCMSVGFRHRVSGPTFAIGLLFLTTYQNSWGKLLHTENLMVVHALILAVSPAGDTFAAGRRRSGVADEPEAGGRRLRQRWVVAGRVAPSGRYGWPIRAMALATVLSYLAAGVSKLRHGGLSWMTADNLGNWIAFDLTRKELFGDPYLSIATRVLDYPWLLAIAAVLTVVIELGAPLALLLGRVTVPWAVAAWAMHVMVLAVMAVAFPYHLAGIALVPVVLATRAGDRSTGASGSRGRNRSRGWAPRPVGAECCASG